MRNFPVQVRKLGVQMTEEQPLGLGLEERRPAH